MKFRRALTAAPIQADMTPMIDVVFQLLIFFLCNLQFKALEGRLDAYLPKSFGAGNQPGCEPLVEVVIRVEAAGERRDPLDPAVPWSGSGRYELVGRRVTYAVGPRRSADLGEVEGWLARLPREFPGRRLQIDARPGTIYADVVPVVDAALAAGLHDVAFVGPYLVPGATRK